MLQFRDEKIQYFLDDLMIGDGAKAEIIINLRKLVFMIHPDVSETFKYGGIMFSHSSDIGGIFAYKDHVTFEFSNGYSFNDPKKILQGTGKYRRNIKIKNFGEIQGNELVSFIGQM